MGACTFYQIGTGDTAREAFGEAVQEAGFNFGHSGYTGSIAEKSSFVTIRVPNLEKPSKKEAYDYADQLIEESDPRIDDKWGPAGCIDLGDRQYLFFGWASE
jgi:hypothetical protein